MSVEPFHLFRYLDAETLRFNNRKATPLARLLKTVIAVIDKRLTYQSLVGEPKPDLPTEMA